MSLRSLLALRVASRLRARLDTARSRRAGEQAGGLAEGGCKWRIVIRRKKRGGEHTCKASGFPGGGRAEASGRAADGANGADLRSSALPDETMLRRRVLMSEFAKAPASSDILGSVWRVCSVGAVQEVDQ